MIAKLKASIKRWVERTGMTEEEIYLGESADHADLMNRMRILDERRRHQSNAYYCGARSRRYY